MHVIMSQHGSTLSRFPRWILGTDQNRDSRPLGGAVGMLCSQGASSYHPDRLQHESEVVAESVPSELSSSLCKKRLIKCKCGICLIK